jgi:hypothetical protein
MLVTYPTVCHRAPGQQEGRILWPKFKSRAKRTPHRKGFTFRLCEGEFRRKTGRCDVEDPRSARAGPVVRRTYTLGLAYRGGDPSLALRARMTGAPSSRINVDGALVVRRTLIRGLACNGMDPSLVLWAGNMEARTHREAALRTPGRARFLTVAVRIGCEVAPLPHGRGSDKRRSRARSLTVAVRIRGNGRQGTERLAIRAEWRARRFVHVMHGWPGAASLLRPFRALCGAGVFFPQGVALGYRRAAFQGGAGYGEGGPHSGSYGLRGFSDCGVRPPLLEGMGHPGETPIERSLLGVLEKIPVLSVFARDRRKQPPSENG